MADSVAVRDISVRNLVKICAESGAMRKRCKRCIQVSNTNESNDRFLTLIYEIPSLVKNFHRVRGDAERLQTMHLGLQHHETQRQISYIMKFVNNFFILREVLM